MISAFVLACALHPFYCHSAAAAPFLAAVDAEVPSEELRAVLVVMAHHESGLQPMPPPTSHDALDGTSCSYLQQQCTRVRGRSPRELVRMYLHDMQSSPTGLAGICGSGPAAARMAVARAHEAERLLRAAESSSTPSPSLAAAL